MWNGSFTGLTFPIAPRRHTSQSSGRFSISLPNRSLKPSTSRTSSSKTTTAGRSSSTTFCQILLWLIKQPTIPLVQNHRADQVATSRNCSCVMALPSVPGKRSTSNFSRLNSSWADSHRAGLRSRFTTRTNGVAGASLLVPVLTGAGSADRGQRSHLRQPLETGGRPRRCARRTASAAPPANVRPPAVSAKAANDEAFCSPCWLARAWRVALRFGACVARNVRPKTLANMDAITG
mmetsp:Transcript_54682/g.127533  ORF Transcript_54682/g.127533 Transcript_54682/m.127533 type:complete len:235 (-) Transcript_54682:37-741(-)